MRSFLLQRTRKRANYDRSTSSNDLFDRVSDKSMTTSHATLRRTSSAGAPQLYARSQNFTKACLKKNLSASWKSELFVKTEIYQDENDNPVSTLTFQQTTFTSLQSSKENLIEPKRYIINNKNKEEFSRHEMLWGPCPIKSPGNDVTDKNFLYSIAGFLWTIVLTLFGSEIVCDQIEDKNHACTAHCTRDKRRLSLKCPNVKENSNFYTFVSLLLCLSAVSMFIYNVHILMCSKGA